MLDPLVGVGPLRFGMVAGEVQTALTGSADDTSSGSQGHYRDLGVTVFYGPGPRLVAVEVDALDGPSVRLRGVELIARVPSELRADLLGLAEEEEAAVRANRHGDPEVPAWGVSIRAAHEWEVAAEGHIQRTSRAITGALLVGPEPAGDPQGFEPDSGGRSAAPDRERARWGCMPLEGVGPLRFGMSPAEVAAALGGAEPSARQGYFPETWPWLPVEAGQWSLSADVFGTVGVTAHYAYWSKVPVLGAVTVDAFAGPQVVFEGIRLIGRPVSEVDAELDRYFETQEDGWRSRGSRLCRLPVQAVPTAEASAPFGPGSPGTSVGPHPGCAFAGVGCSLRVGAQASGGWQGGHA
ncbi:hypothetical protein ABZX88_08300 [Kitasatospora aureofaciens]|uniref:hypothetical protein n=1 Tax=Kitasatospora aureofaciens TaxID=1894 RepID=UPI0033A5DFCB